MLMGRRKTIGPLFCRCFGHRARGGATRDAMTVCFLSRCTILRFTTSPGERFRSASGTGTASPPPCIKRSKHEAKIRMNPIYDFKGQVALVTGAAKGMGLATARMFAESGASVVLADIDGDLAAKEAERIVLEGGTAMGIACDVADEAQVAAMVDRAVAQYGLVVCRPEPRRLGNRRDHPHCTRQPTARAA